eukprot:67506-Chlamydomonas_euryale.AAC.14
MHAPSARQHAPRHTRVHGCHEQGNQAFPMARSVCAWQCETDGSQGVAGTRGTGGIGGGGWGGAEEGDA